MQKSINIGSVIITDHIRFVPAEIISNNLGTILKYLKSIQKCVSFVITLNSLISVTI